MGRSLWQVLSASDERHGQSPKLVRRALALVAYYVIGQRLPGFTRPGGRLSNRFRAACCKELFASSGVNMIVNPRVDFGSGRHVRLGEGSGIGRDSNIAALVVGKNVMMGPELLTLASNHPTSRDGGRWLGQSTAEFQAPEIGDGSWIGARVTLLPGVRIGRSCVIGAGAVVTKDIPDYAVAVGVPARVVRYWNPDASGDSSEQH